MPRTLPLWMVLLVAAAAPANDLYSPPWDRFGEGTTFHTWTFPEYNGGGWSWLPDPGGHGDESSFTTFPGSADWLASYDGRTGIFMNTYPGNLTLIGLPGNRRYLDIYLQVVSHADGRVAVPRCTAKGSPAPPYEVEQTHERPFPNDDWWYDRYHMQVWDTPPMNCFILLSPLDEANGLLLDQVVVDRVPEPGSALLLGLGLLTARRLRGTFGIGRPGPFVRPTQAD